MAKTIPLQNNRGIVIVDDHDYETLVVFKWYLVSGYAARVLIVDGKRKWELMHRMITEVSKDKDIDHINSQKLDNQRHNLRLATRSQNMANKPQHKDNSTGFKGVERLPSGNYRARFRFSSLGVFNTDTEAAIAYDIAATNYYGEFAFTNFQMKTKG